VDLLKPRSVPVHPNPKQYEPYSISESQINLTPSASGGSWWSIPATRLVSPTL